jgi:hypothetical protein
VTLATAKKIGGHCKQPFRPARAFIGFRPTQHEADERHTSSVRRTAVIWIDQDAEPTLALKIVFALAVVFTAAMIIGLFTGKAPERRDHK